jgi:hypothetical protein
VNDTSRRKLLAVAGTGAAAGVVGIAQTRRRGDSAQDSVVAYVEADGSDEVVLMVGEDEVVVHDRDLVHRILNAAGGR